MNDDMARHAVDFAQAADWLAQADGLLITAGAGMGVDSGLPDFRGTEGFWRAYPALAAARLCRSRRSPTRPFCARSSAGLGFYGHRLALYRRTVPHEGVCDPSPLCGKHGTRRVRLHQQTSTGSSAGRFCP